MGLHNPVGRLTQVEAAVEVDVEHPTPVLRWQLIEGKRVEDPGVAHDCIKSSEMVQRGADDGFTALGGGHRVVGGDRNLFPGKDLRHNYIGDARV